MYTIITSPNSILLQKAAPVEKFDAKLHEILSQMSETLLATSDPKGVGLAAPQVGISLRIFLAKPTDRAKISVFINPEILLNKEQTKNHSLSSPSPLEGEGWGEGEHLRKFAQESVEISHPKTAKARGSRKRLLEGCLSIPNIWGNVERKREVTLSYQDEKGKHITRTFKGFAAIIIQHEIDHLNGILFTKHVLEQGEKLYRSYKNEQEEDEFEEIKI